MARSKLILAALIAAALWAPASAAALDSGSVRIQRDSGGVPHVTADNWHSLGFGAGYAFAQDNLCRLANQFVTVRAERSRYFGPQGRIRFDTTGADFSNLDSDFFYQRINQERVVQGLLAKRPPLGPNEPMRELVRGWAQGYNAYLGSPKFDDPTCKGKPWVKPITALDVWRRVYQLVIIASGGLFIGDTVAAQPPAGSPKKGAAGRLRSAALARKLGDTPDPATGSNVFALGAQAMQGDSRGLILANSHLPWSGTERLWENQLTIPGQYNVWGASILGSPIINEGYNGEVGWAHTDDTSRRFVFMQLKLQPGNPTRYLIDGQPHAMKPETVAVKARTPSGLVTRRHTFYLTRYGLVSNLADAGYSWTPTTAYALADSNADNLRAANTWYRLGRAGSIGDVRSALTATMGAPWNNTIAVDRSGRTFYGDIGPVPNASAAKIGSCTPPGIPQIAYQQARLITLDGSRSECGLGSDPGALKPGILAPAHLPSLTRPDWVGNFNDSYWLVNPHRLLTGFSPIVGTEATLLGYRTRLAQLEISARVDGTPGHPPRKFNLGNAKAMIFNDRSLGAELTRDALVQLCEAHPIATASNGQPVDLTEACPVLASYDLHGNLDSAGGWLFSEWWRRTPSVPFGPTGFWADSFDPDHPLTTPHELNTSNPQILRALADAVQSLRARGIPLNAGYGQVQHTTRGARRIPIHGCRMGCLNTIFASDEGPQDIPGTPYGEVEFGSTAIFAIRIGPRGASGASASAHSQATDPTSPFFADGSELYSRKRWLPVRYTQDEIRADPKLRTVILDVPR